MQVLTEEQIRITDNQELNWNSIASKNNMAAMRTLFCILTLVSGSLCLPFGSWGKGFPVGFWNQGVHTVTELNLDYYGRWYEVRKEK